MFIPDSKIETMSEKCEKNHVTPTKVEPKRETKSDESKDRYSSSKDRHSSSKDNYYIKKHIIAAIKRSFRSSSKSLHHSNSDCAAANNNNNDDNEKNDLSSKNRQSVTIIVKRIDLDKESILYTRERESVLPDVINLETFKIKEESSSRSNDSRHHNTHHSTSDHHRKRSSDDRTHHRSEKRHSDAASASTTHQHHHDSDKKRSDESSHKSSNKKHHISEEKLKGPYLLCQSCGRKDEKKWVHADCKNKCCKSTAIYCDSCLRHRIIKNDYCNDLVRGLTFAKYMYVIKCPIGRGSSLHMDYERITHLRSSEQKELAKEFLKQAFKEDDKGFAHFTIAIVHNGARYMPDLLKLLSKTYPTLKVNTTKIKSSTETELSDLLTYYKKVKETYNNGTFCHDPLNETQIACVKNADEYGAYLPEMLSLLERSPFLSPVLPWGEMTTKRFKTPHESDDGPIFWCRPGEQIISLDRNSQRNRWNSGEIETFLKERKKNMFVSEKKLIVEELKKYRRSNSAREFLFEDRTRPHADQAWGNSFEATAAVGVIQAIHPDERPDYNRICKEIIVFQAKHLEILEALLHIDTTAAPKQQCAEWLDDAKLNMIRQMKIEFSKLHLRDNDIYFIPRKIVHQFKTVSATLSIAWHARLREYYTGNSNESTMDLTPILENVSTNCVQRTPKKKNRSRSTSLQSREREGGRSAKKRKSNSQSRSRSSCKKFKEEPSHEIGPSDLADISDAIASNIVTNTVVGTDHESNAIMNGDIEMKSEQSNDTIKNLSESTTTEQQKEPLQPLSISESIKIEPNDEDNPKTESTSDDSPTLLTPRVHIVDIRSHLSKEEPVACANGLTHPLADDSNTTSKCTAKSETSAADEPSLEDTSQPPAKALPITARKLSPLKE